jgi:hypothetical protein
LAARADLFSHSSLRALLLCALTFLSFQNSSVALKFYYQTAFTHYRYRAIPFQRRTAKLDGCRDSRCHSARWRRTQLYRLGGGTPGAGGIAMQVVAPVQTRHFLGMAFGCTTVNSVDFIILPRVYISRFGNILVLV